jgi:hypothetical protein
VLRKVIALSDGGLVYRFYVVPNGRMPIILSAEKVKEST